MDRHVEARMARVRKRLNEAEAQREAAHKERCERAISLVDCLSILIEVEDAQADGDAIRFNYEGHKFIVREVEGE